MNIPDVLFSKDFQREYISARAFDMNILWIHYTTEFYGVKQSAGEKKSRWKNRTPGAEMGIETFRERDARTA